jgi:hypothetical protein
MLVVKVMITLQVKKCNLLCMNMNDIYSGSSKNEEANVPESHNSKSDDEDEEILGSDEDEQEDPKDYCKGRIFFSFLFIVLFFCWLMVGGYYKC